MRNCRFSLVGSYDSILHSADSHFGDCFATRQYSWWTSLNVSSRSNSPN
jgi:hypothetical protein